MKYQLCLYIHQLPDKKTQLTLLAWFPIVMMQERYPQSSCSHWLLRDHLAFTKKDCFLPKFSERSTLQNLWRQRVTANIVDDCRCIQILFTHSLCHIERFSLGCRNVIDFVRTTLHDCVKKPRATLSSNQK